MLIYGGNCTNSLGTKIKEEDLRPGPVENRAGRGGSIALLRGGNEAFANADKAVRRRGAGLVTELLCAGL